MTPYVVEYVLAHLRLLEAVGRLGSFSAAAAELGVTQPNVSRQIGQIERVIGHELFTRGHRGVVLTEAGRLLFEAATESTRRIRDCLGEIAAVEAGRRQIAVVTDYGFGATWLMERLSDFERLCPGVEVQIVTTRNLSETVSGDFRPDVSILFEAGPIRGDDSVFQRKMLFQEEVYPVCSRNYLERHGPFDRLEEIRKAHLLHLKGDGTLWLNWESWFRNEIVDGAQTRNSRLNVFHTFSHFPLLMQSACQDEGIALGWRPLIDKALESGQLVKLWSTPAKSENGYVLTLHRRTSREASAFYQWIIAQAEGRPA
ncbi:MAG: LysR family transcriptional regulator [Acetobacter aceti]|uniref:LysR family transcriptional regulator n=1 Tax=Acetobacter aceti TaxID=435 RepID=UPI001EED82D7|nr:LysR family transcriptional regulator [Acetobacter aceti]